MGVLLIDLLIFVFYLLVNSFLSVFSFLQEIPDFSLWKFFLGSNLGKFLGGGIKIGKWWQTTPLIPRDHMISWQYLAVFQGRSKILSPCQKPLIFHKYIIWVYLWLVLWTLLWEVRVYCFVFSVNGKTPYFHSALILFSPSNDLMNS